MTIRIEDPWQAAKCREQVYVDWMRKRLASMWDWHVEGETKEQKANRHFKARGLCFACPLRAECLARHDELVKQNGRASGIWGGRVFADREDDDRNDHGAVAA